MSHDLTDADLRCLLAALIGTFPTAISKETVNPLPVDLLANGNSFQDAK